MYRDVEDRRVGVEDRLCAITMVEVDVEDCYSCWLWRSGCGVVVPIGRDGDGSIVDVAVAAGTGAVAVVAWWACQREDCIWWRGFRMAGIDNFGRAMLGLIEKELHAFCSEVGGGNDRKISVLGDAGGHVEGVVADAGIDIFGLGVRVGEGRWERKALRQDRGVGFDEVGVEPCLEDGGEVVEVGRRVGGRDQGEEV